MATVTIFHLAVTKHSKAIAFRLVNTVLTEAEVIARQIAATGVYSTGRLASSINRDGPHQTPLGVSGNLSSNLPYAKVAHNGAKIHAIFPRGAPGMYRFGSRRKPQLHFFWRRKGKAVYFPHIPGSPTTVGRSHPGMKGLHYLTIPLRSVARRHHFRVFIREG